MINLIKNSKFFVIYVPIVGVIMWFCMGMIFSGTVSLSMNGFAVDKDGYLYVGKEKDIVVFNEGEIVRTISPKTSRGYQFTILSGEKILLSTSSVVYTMDLSGEILSKEEDVNTKIYNKLQREKSFFTAEDGTEYHTRSYWGRTQICKNNEVIYEMPLLDYIVRVLIIVVLIGLGILLITIFYPMIRDKKLVM